MTSFSYQCIINVVSTFLYIILPHNLYSAVVAIVHNELHSRNEEKRYYEMELQKQIVPTTDDDSKLATTCALTTTIAQEGEARLTTERKRGEMDTRNTFGWARLEILTMLIVCITLASLSFSLLVEALQTLVHIDHQDSMHLPIHVMIVGVVGLLLNGLILIGGYTLHQGNFLHINPLGNVVVESSGIAIESNGLSETSVNSDHQLKEDLRAELSKVHDHTRREGPAEFLRDVSSTIFVIVCAVIVHFAKDKEHTAKFIDPVLSIFSCVLVMTLSYPYKVMGDAKETHGTPQFRGEEFDDWQFPAKIHLDSQNLLDVLTGNPPSSATASAEYKKKNKKAMDRIFSFVHSYCLSFIRHKESATDMWNSHDAAFGQKSMVNQLLLKKKLANLRMNSGESIVTHI
uniref:Cation efflux protein transmembrane domain-containing protein n=1 Tax=Stomoxys calcitrans TaxID=35570 RepID=A0A1I8PUT3_STOCA